MSPNFSTRDTRILVVTVVLKRSKRGLKIKQFKESKIEFAVD